MNYCLYCMRPVNGSYCPHCRKDINWEAAPSQLPAGTVLKNGEKNRQYLTGAVLGQGQDGAVVVYGMPGRCMMAVDVDGAARGRAEELLSMMEELE